jgi:hypothetical protein
MGCIAKGPHSAADTWSESYKFTSFTRHNWACLVKVRMQKARLGICKYGEQAIKPLCADDLLIANLANVFDNSCQ